MSVWSTRKLKLREFKVNSLSNSRFQWKNKSQVQYLTASQMSMFCLRVATKI